MSRHAPHQRHARSTAGDILALAVHLRQNVEHAIQAEIGESASVEGRFLRRLSGALSAYEAAYGILAAPEVALTSSGPAPLTRQFCPSCGRSEFEAVSGGWTLHLLCRHCNTCARPERRALIETDPDTCAGCEFITICTNRNAAHDSPQRTSRIPSIPAARWPGIEQ
jgi:hypothetical protein